MKDFDYWERKFSKQELIEFSSDKEAILWLKLKSISKKEPMNRFIEFSQTEISAKKIKQRWRELYEAMVSDLEASQMLLDNYAQKETSLFLEDLNIESLSDELYKVQHFKWGGDQTNSLDKYLVSHYVKGISSYDVLHSKVQEIGEAAYGYVLSSWYNHWSSILIESVFKSHSCVISTVGQVKGVDFFINDIPFDLKVTHLPKGFICDVMRRKGYPKELSYLKKEAKSFGLSFDKNASEEILQYQIWNKLKDLNTPESNIAINTVSERRQEVLEYALNNPTELSRWLYENQGDMRFGAENRIYLILIDNQNWENSWSLKRNIKLLRPEITRYLDRFSEKNLIDMQLDFTYNSRSYTTYADILFIIK